MEKHTFTIPRISCGHCVMSIKNELGDLAGITAVEGDPGAKTLTVQWTPPATEGKIRDVLKEMNYPAE